jgi:hypothetical protein
MKAIEIDNVKYEFRDDVWVWRQLFLKSEWFATKYLCGFHEGNVKKGIIKFPMYKHLHGEMINAIQYMPYTRLAVFVFRGAGKSSAITVGDNIYDIIKNRNIRIGIAPGNMKLGKQFLDQIKNIIKSPLFRACFPEIIPKHSHNSSESNWSKTSCTVNRSSEARKLLKEPTIDLITEKSLSEGFHYDKIVGNDLVHRDNYKTENARETTKEFFRNFENLIADKSAPIKIEGTFWHPDDVYTSEIMTNSEYAKFYLPIYDNEGNSVFPEQFPEERLRIIRAAEGEKMFATQFLLQPIADAEAPLSKYPYVRYREIFKEGRVVRITEDGREFADRIVPNGTMVANDTAGAGKNLAGMSVTQLDEKGRYWVRWGKLKDNWKPLELYEELKMLNRLFDPYKIGIELASQLMWESVLPAEALTVSSPIKYKLDELEHRNEPKKYRMLNLQAPLAQEKMFFHEGISDKFIKEVQFCGQMADTAAPDCLSGAISLYPKHNIFVGNKWQELEQPDYNLLYLKEQWDTGSPAMDEHLTRMMRE